MSRLSFQIGILPDRPVREIAELAAYAEAYGFEGIWVADSQSIFRDAFATLAVCAGRTETMRLATGVTNPVTRHPAVLAHSFATLDELSDGRATLGIGVGESAVATLGLPKATLRELEDTTHTLRALMAGEPTVWQGRELKLTWSRRHIPIVFASSGPRSLRLAGKIADGVLFQVGAAPSFAEYALRNVQAGVDEAGRRRMDVKRLMRLACAIDDDAERARDEARAYASVAAGTIFATIPRADVPPGVWDDLAEMKERYDYYEHGSHQAAHRALLTDRILDAVAIAGTPDEAVARFRRLAELDIDGFVIPLTTGDPRKVIRLLAERVIPAVA